jgi:ribosome biogenesis GTPase / thiamine phosphate phosphatase
MPSLNLLGWTADRAAAFAPFEARGLLPARVMSEHKGGLALSWEGGELLGSPSARLRAQATAAVGDWVAFEPPASGRRAWVHEVLPRASAFVRKAAGREVAGQVVAANVDAVFLCTALGHDLNPRRLERYLALSWQSGAQPVVVLTKLDLHPELLPEALALCAEVAPGVPVHPLSALTGEGVADVRAYPAKDRTVALLGSSGVGKSTLVNRLLGADRQAVLPVLVRDERGRHATARRDLFLLPGGGLLLDTPGMRELQLWDAEEGVARAFADIEALAASCRYADCSHAGDAGCAVAAAVEQGDLAPERLDSYLRLGREMDRLRALQDERARAERKGRDKSLARALRARLREKGRRD